VKVGGQIQQIKALGLSKIVI